MRDAQLAVETGVDGLDVVIGTSSFLREHSHGKDMAYITKTALEVIEYIKSKGLEVRCEFTSSIPSTLIRITHAIPKPPAASCNPRISSRYLLLETPMSTREMMSQDRRTTTTMSGLATAGEASGAEIVVPVG
jgi:hypothetical protein